MKARPILFSKPMVLALLAGTKTQTRRAMKVQPPEGTYFEHGPAGEIIACSKGTQRFGAYGLEKTEYRTDATCPHGAIGEQLWVREAYRLVVGYDLMRPSEVSEDVPIRHEADGLGAESTDGWLWGKLRPSMFMPRWASRITLEVTSVCVERLQDISEVDARAEGCRCNEDTLAETGFATYRDAYKALWETINGDTSWDLNPWVWAIEFRRLA